MGMSNAKAVADSARIMTMHSMKEMSFFTFSVFLSPLFSKKFYRNHPSMCTCRIIACEINR